MTEYDRPVTDAIKQGRIEYFIQSKKGPGANAAFCEDGLFYSDAFLAVFDGASDFSGLRVNGKSGGVIARELIGAAFTRIEAQADCAAVLAAVNLEFQQFYEQNGCVIEPVSTLIWYSFYHNTLYAVGDSKARVHFADSVLEINTTVKNVDVLNAALRLQVIQLLGLSEAEVAEFDIGRQYITPLILRQTAYMNNLQAPPGLQYAGINGSEVPRELIEIRSFDTLPSVIELSTDGYEYFGATADIAAYEASHERMVREDPLRLKYPATKGMLPGDISFDDRCVLIFRAQL